MVYLVPHDQRVIHPAQKRNENSINAVDILSKSFAGGTSPARKPASKPASGPDPGSVYKDIFGGGSSKATHRQVPNASPTSHDIEPSVRELEEMLGVGSHKKTSAPSAREPSRVPSQPTNWNLPLPGRIPAQLPPAKTPGIDADRKNQQAVILIRAMIMAAKADGRLNPEERNAILEQLGDVTPDVQCFIEREFQTSRDARDFAWSVPLGLEQKVYAISLTAINLDVKSESDYLRLLAHGLRIPADVCDQIHQRFGIPLLSS